MSDSRTLFEKLKSSTTVVTTAIAAGTAGVVSTIVNGVIAVRDNTLSKDIFDVSRNCSDSEMANTLADLSHEVYRSSNTAGNTVLATFALPTFFLNAQAVHKWGGIPGLIGKVTRPAENAVFDLGLACQVAGFGLIIKGSSENGAHNPQSAIAWSVGGMMLMNLGSVLILAKPKPCKRGPSAKPFQLFSSASDKPIEESKSISMSVSSGAPSYEPPAYVGPGVSLGSR